MALTAANYQACVDTGLVKFFEQNRPLFTQMAHLAYGYAHTFVSPTGLAVRVDDVSQALVPALEVSEPLTKFLQARKMRQKYWPVRFADLVLDQLWKELEDAQRARDEHSGQ